MNTRAAALSLPVILFALPLAHFGSNLQPTQAQHVTAVSAHPPRTVEAFAGPALSFEPNVGQSDGRVKFLTHRGGFAAFLTTDGVVFTLQPPSKAEAGGTRVQPVSFHPTHSSDPTSRPTVFEMKLLGANKQPEIEGVEELLGKTNYLIGSDPTKWRANVTNYRKARYRDVYKGADLYFYGHDQQLEYDFVVRPGGDPSAIRLKFEGTTSLKVDGNGDLVVTLGKEHVSFHKPVMYQRAADGSGIDWIDGAFVLDDRDQVSFFIPNYDVARPLTIDPVLSYGTYVGAGEQPRGIAVDSGGDVYAVFHVSRLASPSRGDVFVTKLDPTGSTLLYSTYVGGTMDDFPCGIAIDSSGNAYITGYAFSSDFPVTQGAFQTTLRTTQVNGSNGFVTELNSSGSIKYSSYLGGSGIDVGYGIALDSTPNVYVTGSTTSTDFPVTSDAFQGSLHGATDTFVTKLNLNATGAAALLYSTFLGGTNLDYPIGIGLDSQNNIYVTGNTASTDFPLANALQSTPSDIFVTKFNAAGTLAYSTYFATGPPTSSSLASDTPRAIVVDPSGDAYLTGFTNLSTFPTTPGSFQPSVTLNTAGTDFAGFVLKLNPSGSALVYSTFLGVGVFPGGLAVDASGRAYVSAGYNPNSSAGPPPAEPFPMVNPISNQGGAGTSLLAQLNASGSATPFASWFVGGYLALDPSGNLYVASASPGFIPTTAGAYDTNGTAFGIHAFGFANLWLGKVSPANAASLALAPWSLSFSDTPVGQNSSLQTITVDDVGTVGVSVTGITFSNGDFVLGTDSCSTMPPASTCSISVSFSPTATGPRTGTMTIDYNDGTDKTAVVSLAGNGFNPPLVFDFQSPIDFGYVVVSKTSPSQTMTIRNPGDTVAIGGIVITGDFQQTNTCGSSIPTQATCSVTITFAPTAAGPRTGTLTITANAQGSPYAFALAGTGVVGGLAVANPTSLTFGTQSVGTTSAPQSVTLTNTGTANINLNGISPSGEFAETNNCPVGSTLAPNANCTVSVKFSPKAAGTRTGTISFFDSSPNAPQTVQLTGTAIDWALSGPSGSGASQTVAAGQPASYQVSLTSTGFVGSVSLSCSDSVVKSTCALNNSTVTFTAAGSVSVMVSVGTTAHSGGFHRVDNHRGFPIQPGLLWAWLACGLALASGARFLASRKFLPSAALLRVSLGLVLLAGIYSCGGSGYSGATPTNPGSPSTNTGTPAGNYTIQLNATAQGTTQTVNLQLTVQ